MPYISELLNNTITDSSDAVVGKLEDILVSYKEDSFDPLEFLVIKTSGGQTKFAPYDFVANFTSSQISLKNLFSKIALTELPAGHQFVYLKKEVLDRQIVDVAGTRVVRVDDLRIGVVENKMCVLGIDRSFRAILRRLGINGSIFNRLFPVNLIDWRQAKFLEGTGPLQLNTAVEALSQLHPADLANIVEELDVKSGSSLLASLDSGEAARVLEEVNPELQTILARHLGPERAGKILGQMSSDEFADLVKTFTGPEASEFLSKVSGGRAQNVKKLLAYPDNTAGGLMTLDFFSARPEWSAGQTVEEIRKISGSIRSIVHVYVSDEDGKFRGAVSMRRLLLAGKEELMKNLAKDFPRHSTLKPGDKIPKVISLMTKYNLYTAAVLDKDKKLLGVVTIDDVMRLLAPSA
jgi:CBS domain-containing protein/sporulation protein YlmC with PRC-barrel domain